MQTRDAYFAGIELGEDFKLEANDALAVDIMRQKTLMRYTHLMSHFDHIEGIKKPTKTVNMIAVQ